MVTNPPLLNQTEEFPPWLFIKTQSTESNRDIWVAWIPQAEEITGLPDTAI